MTRTIQHRGFFLITVMGRPITILRRHTFYMLITAIWICVYSRTLTGRCHLHGLNNLCNTHIPHGSSGLNNTIISGHPFGGCAILWCADIEAQVCLAQTNNDRICCIRACNEHYKLLLVNVFMPYESDATVADEFSSVHACWRHNYYWSVWWSLFRAWWWFQCWF